MFLQDWRCGCGSPEAWAQFLLNVLSDPSQTRGMDDGLRYFVLYTLDAMGLTEHGSSVDGWWLTEKGREVQSALLHETEDEFAGLFPEEPVCIHGYDTSDKSHDCFAVTRKDQQGGER